MEVISGKIPKPKKVVIYGPEGIGKSSLAAQFPNPIFIDTEGSTTELNVNRLRKPSSWTMLNEQIDWVKQQVGRFKTLAIDTVDWAEMLCIEAVCAQHNKKGIEDFGYGNGYVYVKEELGRFLNKLSDVIEAGLHVVLTAHSQIVKFEQPDEMGAYDRYQLKLGKKTSSQTAPLVKEWADMVLFLNYKTISVAADDKGKKHKAQGGARMIYATHHPAWDAKNRHGLPDEFPLDYSYIAHIFNDTQQANSAPMQQVPPISDPLGVQARTEFQTVQQTQPVEEQQPIKNASPETDTAELSPMIPQSLRDLMIQNNVSEEEIQIVVSQKGYYPMDTPIINYDPGFVEGVLVGAWPQVYGMIVEFRKSLPFN